jgi:hypothetical protein
LMSFRSCVVVSILTNKIVQHQQDTDLDWSTELSRMGERRHHAFVQRKLMGGKCLYADNFLLV